MKVPDSEQKKLPEVVQRVQQMLDHYGLNASSATQLLGYSTTSKLYNILKGSEPSYPTLVDFLKQWPEVSPTWLMLGTGPMLLGENGGTQPPAAGKPAHEVSGIDRVLAVTVDKDGDENTSLVPVPAQAGYVRQHNEAVFLRQLRHYRIPGFEHGSFRAFEVEGDSMESTIRHSDVVIGSVVDRWDLLRPGEVYVVVTAESVMLKRIRERITDMSGLVWLHSDNPSVKPYQLPVADISQLWRVRGYLSTYIPSAPEITVERMFEIIDRLGFDRGEVRRYLEEESI